MIVREKDTEGFLSVIEMHKGIIYKIAHAYCKNKDDKKDLIQEIMVQLWKSFGKYDNRYKHSTWIYRISLNVAISLYRKENRRTAIANPITNEMLCVSDTYYNSEPDVMLVYLQRFISELKELDKALMLLYLEQKSHKEIAEIMELSESNVATKVGRIKEKLKIKFSQLHP